MTFCVDNPNIPDTPCPQRLDELVDFVKYVQNHPNSIFVQMSGYGEEVVKALAEHFGCNFFSSEDVSMSGLNPFTIIYINKAGEIVSRSIDQKSNIVIYARRPVYNHN